MAFNKEEFTPPVVELVKLSPSTYELRFSNRKVLFSYNRAVAVQETDGTVARTDTKFSSTTSAHVTKWLKQLKCDKTWYFAPQSVIEAKAEGRDWTNDPD